MKRKIIIIVQIKTRNSNKFLWKYKLLNIYLIINVAFELEINFPKTQFNFNSFYSISIINKFSLSANFNSSNGF